MSENKNTRFVTLAKKILSLLEIAALCLAFMVFTAACAQKQEKQDLLTDKLLTSKEQANYKTVQVEIGGYEKLGTGKASVIYLLKSELCWEKDNAYYAEAVVRAGQEVKEGDVLVRFDVKEDRVELESLKLQLLRKKEDTAEEKESRLAAIEDAKAEAKALRKQESKDYEAQIAELQIKKLQAQYEQFLYQSEKEVSQMEERISEIEQSMQENVLTAPFDGIVDAVTRYNEGDKVAPGQVLVTMYATDRLLLKAEGASGKLRYNMDVIIEAGNANNRASYSGKVIAAPNILPASLSQNLTLIELDEKVTPDDLKGNISYQGKTEELQNILVVNRDAIQKEDEKTFVNILEGGTVQKRYVVTAINNAENVWILDGLSEGQTLIVD